MTSQDKRRDFLDEVRDEEYRHEFVSEHVTVGLAFQLKPHAGSPRMDPGGVGQTL